MTPRQAKLGVDIFTGAMIASVAVALAGLTWRLAGDPGTGLAASPSTATQGAPTDLAPIIALAPFGSSVAATGTSAPGAMQLRGILLANPIEASSVLIALDNGPVVAFRIGQMVGGATIERVAMDHVILRTADGTQMLGFPERTATGGVALAVTAPGSPAATAASGAQPTPSGVDAIRALIPEAVRGGAATSAATAQPPAPTPSVPSPFLDSLGATPTAGGYRVGTAASPAMQAAGLRAGDVIERVNGNALGDSTRDQQLISSAMASGSARVEIMRDGRRISLSVPLR